MNTKSVHRNHLVEYSRKEETQPPMIAENVPMDRCRDRFFERFMEQRFHNLNNPEQFRMEDFLPFLVGTLRTVPTALPE